MKAVSDFQLFLIFTVMFDDFQPRCMVNKSSTVRQTDERSWSNHPLPWTHERMGTLEPLELLEPLWSPSLTIGRGGGDPMQ